MKKGAKVNIDGKEGTVALIVDQPALRENGFDAIGKLVYIDFKNPTHYRIYLLSDLKIKQKPRTAATAQG